MNFSRRKTSFLPLLIILWLHMPFIVLAQTTEMTDRSEIATIETTGTDSIIVSGSAQSELSSIDEESLVSWSGTEIAQKYDNKVWENRKIKNTKKNKEFSFDIPNVDTEKVQQARLGRTNAVRSEDFPYTFDDTLDNTALERSTVLAKENRTKNMHRRPGQKCSGARCYNYNTMIDRWQDRDVDTSTITESIARNTYNCNADDCTDKFIAQVRKWFNFFMSEARRNWPHYKSLTSKRFKKVWLGIAVSKGKFYLVMHVSD
jgi:hypothetical protein